MRFGLICEDPHRVESFERALEQCGFPAPTHLTYRDCLKSGDMGRARLDGVDIIRLDSPGGDHAIWSEISKFSGFETQTYPNEFGRIFPMAPFMAGFEKIVNTISASVTAPTTFDPEAIFLFADKRRTHSWCKAHGLPVPKVLPQITSCTDLMDSMAQLGIRRVFLKIRYGSAASGILAIETQGHHIRAITTVERQRIANESRLYNSLKIRKYLDDEARELINDILVQFDVHIEEWIPKLRINNHPSDIRLLVINGKPAHTVVRCSESPITNLHLGNQRHSAEALGQLVSKEMWQHIQNIGSKIASYYPNQFCFGLDIGIDNKTKDVFIIEINAFGDHLNHVEFEGLDPYTYQIKALEKIYAER